MIQKKQSRARVKWKNNALPYLNLGTIGAGLVYPGGNRWEGGFKPPLSAGNGQGYTLGVAGECQRASVTLITLEWIRPDRKNLLKMINNGKKLKPKL